ncbi:MAG: methionine synthase, partial [Comamonadaceae bacterium]|nr:methionine synthase [Comamonadaceae bacterium]
TANGVMGIFPANRVGDDIEFYTDESRSQVLMTWYGLRQQTEKQPGPDGVMRPSRCLSDFVAPKESGIADYAGLFAVTAGIGSEKKEKEFLDALDDYSAIMFKGLADRLAEAFAECLHQRVRQDLWGYGAGESLSNAELIAEKYQGIRPAPGYPACPDHTAKIALFETLAAREIGMELTESMAMFPASSVSGFYLAHPQAQYFIVGQIGDDQVQDMAARRGMDVEELRRRLAPNLSL